jgi:hypothetical protein
MGKISSYTVTDDALTDVLLGDTSAPTTVRFNKDRMLGFGNPAICNGRLTTETGVPVSTADRTAQGTLYFTPYLGNRISLYDGTRWRLYTFTEKSIALTVTSGKNYDVFLYDNAGTLTIELSAAWTTDTARADAMALQDGITCKSGALTRRLIGTIRASAANVTEDSKVKRFVWSYYNRVRREIGRYEAAASWTYNVATIRQANANTANQVDIVVGEVDVMIDLSLQAKAHCGDTSGDIANATDAGIGEDSTTAMSASCNAGGTVLAGVYGTGIAGGTYGPLVSRLSKMVPLGRHFYTWLEYVENAATATFYGTAMSGLRNPGLQGWIEG